MSKENGFPSAGDDDKQSLLMTASGKLGCLSQHQILRFYNAIAAGGTLSAEGPEKRLCSQAVADTLRALLAQNITSGTNRQMAGQGVSVAGKTGTAYIKPGMQIPGTLTPAEEGKLLHSTFAGFFPTENPEYTLVITVVYDSSTTAYVIPGNIATNVIKRIDPQSGSESPVFSPKSRENRMKRRKIAIFAPERDEVPKFSGESRRG